MVTEWITRRNGEVERYLESNHDVSVLIRQSVSSCIINLYDGVWTIEVRQVPGLEDAKIIATELLIEYGEQQLLESFIW